MIDEDVTPERELAPPAGSETTASSAAAAENGSPGDRDQSASGEESVRGEMDQTVSERDQTAADSDQTSSDSDQTLSEREEAQAEADQRISNRDQAVADREHAARRSPAEDDGAYELSRAQRLAGTLARTVTSEERVETAAERLEQATRRDASAHARDRNAEARDRTAAERDLAAEELERTLGLPRSALAQARDKTAALRARAAADRARAAGDREQAAADRASAAEERALARAELRSAQAHTSEVVGQIAGGVAHNFSNLLAVVLLCANQLIPRADELGEREDLEQIITAADRGAELTRELLAFAGLGRAGRLPIDLSQAISRREPALRGLMSSGVDIDFQLDTEELAVIVDGAELDHVVLNLALNARDAMETGGTVVIASRSRAITQEEQAERDVKAGGYVQVSVSDTGSGIPADVLSRIFEPFFTTKGQGHTGLGLATVHGVVDQAGGWIDVKTAIGAGTTFCVTLPEERH